MADVLKRDTRSAVQVFVIWEPVLTTDWGKPGSGLTSNVADARAVHYWDPERHLSAMFGGPAQVNALAAQHEIAFKMKDVVWDAALIYPPGALWGARADLLVAPVFKFPNELSDHLSQMDHTVSTVAWVTPDESSRRRSSHARP